MKVKSKLWVGACASSLIFVTACGGGGGSTDIGGKDVLSAYVSEFTYSQTTPVVRAWDSKPYVLTPKITYIKPNSDLVFTLVSAESGVSLDTSSGRLTIGNSYLGGCVGVRLAWAKTGESLVAQPCLDREYIDYGVGLSKSGANDLRSDENGWLFTISKSDPATISFNVGLTYYDRARNETVSLGGVLPDRGFMTCAVIDSTLPSFTSLHQTSQSSTAVGYELAVNWSDVSAGEYSYNFQCTVSVAQETAIKTVRHRVKVIN